MYLSLYYHIFVILLLEGLLAFVS